MLKFLAPYKLLSAAVVTVLAIGYVAYLNVRLAHMEGVQGRLQSDLAVCMARTSNILEDQASDREIDSLDTDALRDLARRWMLDNAPE